MHLPIATRILTVAGLTHFGDLTANEREWTQIEGGRVSVLWPKGGYSQVKIASLIGVQRDSRSLGSIRGSSFLFSQPTLSP